jgi:RHS repeat-associated protein
LGNATPAQAITNLYAYSSVTNAADGTVSYGLRVQEIRAALSPDAATNEWAYSSRGFPVRMARYTGTADPAVVVTNFYNTRGEVVVQTDAAGRSTVFGYDPRGAIQSREVFDVGQPGGPAQAVPMAWEYSYYNENGEPTWSDGPRFDPEDYVWRDYDGAGRKSQEIHWRSEGLVDGTGVQAASGDDLYATSFYQYDPFNNLTKVTDPLGNYSVKKYDSVGQLLREEFYSANNVLLATNGFAYSLAGDVTNAFNALGGRTEKQYTSTGRPKFQRNADGSTNGWLYRVDGRVQREYWSNGSYWETAYNDAARQVTRVFHAASGTPLATNVTVLDRRGNAIQTVDAASNTFTNSYDGLDRLKIAVGPPIVTVQEACGQVPGCGVYVTNVLQHALTNFFDAAGVSVTNANALGEKTVTTRDALGRVVSAQTYAAGAGAPLRMTTTSYAANHHGFTVTEGSGADAISTTTWTDNDGHPVLNVRYPFGWLSEYTLNFFDRNGNGIETDELSNDGWSTYVWAYTLRSFDGLNRLAVESVRDEAATTYNRDALGNVTNRVMPGGLQWFANYSSAGQMLQDWIIGSDGSGTRTNAYTYYPAGNAWAGLTQTRSDARGLTGTYSYDNWLRVTNIARTTTDPYTTLTTRWEYEPRGYATKITELDAGAPTGPNPRVVSRGFDAYGQMVSESITLNGAGFSSAGQTWDADGRRSQLSLNGFNFGFGWRADGALASVGAGNAGATYGYDSAAVLTNRTVGNRVTSVTSRDGVGRPLSISTKVNLATVLNEALDWNDDGTLSAHTLARSDFTDSRSYQYQSYTRRLIEERMNLDAGTRWTNSFVYDGGAEAGLGVLTKAGAPNSGSASWSGGTSVFAQVNTETNTGTRKLAYGRMNGPATVTALLDGKPLPVSINTTPDHAWSQRWQTEMELSTGAHQLAVSALHPSGRFTTNATSWFTNNVAQEAATVSRDAAGNIIKRIWRNPDGTTNRTQRLWWDAKERLYRISDVDRQYNGYLWQADYDGLDRRLQTRWYVTTNGVTQLYGVTPVTINSYYDPLAEFLELGVSVSGTTTWKLCGPDLNGRYGAMNGTGGFEAVAFGGTSSMSPIISDARGNVLGAVTNGSVTWNESRPTGYGAVAGRRPLPLGHGGNLVQSSGWRGRWVDITGWVNLGARYYDPVAGSFLNVDPMWNNRDPNYHTFAGGDPINYFDPDGRFGKGVGSGALDMGIGTAAFLRNSAGALAYSLTSSFAPDWSYRTFGDNAAGFGNTVAGIWNTGNDISGAGLYATTSSFAPDWAYQNFGSSMENLGQVGTAMSGGDGNSTAYRAGYTTIGVFSLLAGGELGQVGKVGRAGEASDLAFQGTRALKMPNTADLTAQYGSGIQGITTSSGEVILQQGLSRAKQAETLAHESVHAFLTPQSGSFVQARQWLGQFGYDNSAFLQGTEEIMAQTYASGKLSEGLAHAFNGEYKVRGSTVVTPWNYMGEAALGAGSVGGLTYGSYYLGNSLFGGQQ